MIHPLSSFFKNNYDPTHNTTQDAYEIFSIHIFIDIENKKYTLMLSTTCLEIYKSNNEINNKSKKR